VVLHWSKKINIDACLGFIMLCEFDFKVHTFHFPSDVECLINTCPRNGGRGGQKAYISPQ
jgi:hypothetical protein